MHELIDGKLVFFGSFVFFLGSIFNVFWVHKIVIYMGIGIVDS
jgi:hypothetical protein